MHLRGNIETSKSNAIFDIASLISLDVITYDDLTDFSEDLQQAVKMICNGFR